MNIILNKNLVKNNAGSSGMVYLTVCRISNEVISKVNWIVASKRFPIIRPYFRI